MTHLIPAREHGQELPKISDKWYLPMLKASNESCLPVLTLPQSEASWQPAVKLFLMRFEVTVWTTS